MVSSIERFHCIQDSQLGPSGVHYREVPLYIQSSPWQQVNGPHTDSCYSCNWVHEVHNEVPLVQEEENEQSHHEYLLGGGRGGKGRGRVRGRGRERGHGGGVMVARRGDE